MTVAVLPPAVLTRIGAPLFRGGGGGAVGRGAGGCVPSDVGHAGVSGRKAVGSSLRFLPFSFLGGMI